MINNYEKIINEYIEIDWDYALANTKKHPNQKMSTSIGVGTDGKTVNMDLWEYTLLNDGTYALNDSDTVNLKVNPNAGYIGNITDGKIEGTIPTYISENNGHTFSKVTSLSQTFRNLKSLTIMPELPITITDLTGTFCDTDIQTTGEIPYGVKIMNGTFGRCYNLKITPQLPDTVEDMTSTFYNCSNLTQITNIPNQVKILASTFEGNSKLVECSVLPDSVINMSGTFRDCVELKKVDNIPNNVTNMNTTFSGCSKLVDISEIPNNVETMADTFRNCTSIINPPTILSNKLSNMKCTFSGCKLLIKSPQIPYGVKNMHGTFENCTSLVNPPNTIPDSVINMPFTFYNCVKLQGSIKIDANLQGKVVENDMVDYHACFASDACKNGNGLVILKSSITSQEILNNLINGNSKIIIEQ